MRKVPFPQEQLHSLRKVKCFQRNSKYTGACIWSFKSHFHFLKVWCCGYIPSLVFTQLRDKNKGVDICSLSNQACTKYSAKSIQQFPYDPHTWRVAQDFHKASYLHWNSSKTLQKINKILINSVIGLFSANSFFWRQDRFFLTIKVPPICACSLIKSWWFSLNRIWVLTTLFLNNFFFWWSPDFLHLNLPTVIHQKSICNFN